MRRTRARSIAELYDSKLCSFDDWMDLCALGPNYIEIIKTALELQIKYELDIQRNDMWEYAINKAREYPMDPLEINEFKNIFNLNNITNIKLFVSNLKLILNKEKFKLNALRFYGAPNSCKTLIADAIVAPFIACKMNNHGSENEFYLSNMLNKSIIQCEELYLTTSTAEDFKSILGGHPIDVSKKFWEKQLLQRTPVIITTNYTKFGRGHLPPLDEMALASRCITYHIFADYTPKCTLHWYNFYYFLLDVLYNKD